MASQFDKVFGRKVADWEVVDHGVENSQYFQGCGTACTDYEDVATGIGSDAAEALEDALESLAQNGWDTEGVEAEIQADIGRGPRRRRCVAEDDHEDLYYYLSVRVRGERSS